MGKPNPFSNRHHRRTRRQAARPSSKVYCYLGPLGLGRNYALNLVNLSEEGACIVTRALLQVNQVLELNLESLQHRRPVRILGEVVWSRSLGDGTFTAGVRFERTLPWQDVQSLTKQS
jgi:hypothetical protein